MLGSVLDVSVNWDLKFSDISFTFIECNVEQGDAAVTIIREGCYSESLQVVPISETSFQMMTFSIDNQTDQNRFIVCKIKLCMDGCKTNTDQCPDDEHYSYSIAGFVEP